MTTADPDVEYAFWTSPGTAFTVTYPLGLFHEIDFQVNEGYRRIPHGGVETGGLLFGRSEPGSARIEAFRNIECEHASGPSFVLSERDLTRLKEQISASASEPELHGLSVLGWFIGHTRSPLKMNDGECALFDELFPGTGKITLLIKPERFQPTRFGFLVRGPDGQSEKDASQRAIILPLPGRAGKSSEGPIASIPAPVNTPPATPQTKPPQAPAMAAEPMVQRGLPTPSEPPARMALAPQPVQARARERAETTEVVPAASLSPSPNLPDIGGPYPESAASQELIEFRPSHQQTRKLDREGTPSSLRLLLVLLLAAALGCAVGYWAYSQLPSATIALNVHAEPSTLLISWPAEQTRNAVYAALRVDDGQSVALSPEEKASGEAEITLTSDNVKVELIAQHWMRDSRGIVRYVKPLPPVTMQLPEATQPAPHPPPSSEPR